jgi:RHS repeat-associated protein
LPHAVKASFSGCCSCFCGAAGCSSDACGNRTQKNALAGITFYSWDVPNRLSVAQPPAGAVTLTYDGLGRRVRKDAPGLTRKFIYDFQKVLQETDGANATQKEYTTTTQDVYGDLVSEFNNTNTFFHAYDGLGSTDALVDQTGAVADRYAYRAFGLEVQTPPDSGDSPHTWVGRKSYRLDLETSLYFLDARYYDPATGRFVSEDPLGFQQPDPNLFRYAGNNPVYATDPSGLD